VSRHYRFRRKSRRWDRRRSSCIDHAFHIIETAGFQHIGVHHQERDEETCGLAFGHLDRALDAGDMADIVGIPGDLLDEIEIAQIAAHIFGFGMGEQFVERYAGDAGAGFVHQAHHLAADQAGAAGNDNALAGALGENIFLQQGIVP